MRGARWGAAVGFIMYLPAALLFLFEGSSGGSGGAVDVFRFGLIFIGGASLAGAWVGMFLAVWSSRWKIILVSIVGVLLACVCWTRIIAAELGGLHLHEVGLMYGGLSTVLGTGIGSQIHKHALWIGRMRDEKAVEG